MLRCIEPAGGNEGVWLRKGRWVQMQSVWGEADDGAGRENVGFGSGDRSEDKAVPSVVGEWDLAGEAGRIRHANAQALPDHGVEIGN